jgi:NAD(P)-dependent dehydrogenase (short-subunit alcohol dehydrogenase family)
MRLNLFLAQGVLINTGSIDSEVPIAYQACYATSKAAVLSLSRTFAEELRLSGQEGHQNRNHHAVGARYGVVDP